MTPLLETAARVTVVIVMSLLCAACMRKRAAVVRHWILAVGLLCAAAMPLLQTVTPTWDLPRAASRYAFIDAAALDVPRTRPWVTVTDTVGFVSVAQAPRPLLTAAAWIWIAGALIAITVLCSGFTRLTWIATRCEPVIDDRWIAPLRQIAVQLGVRRDITLLQSEHDHLLVTCGLLRPRIVLPAAATEWTDDRIRLVLCHELSHVRRNDWTLQLLAAFLRAVYWFNPLVWVACHWLRHESERACDDDVLSLGMTGPEYATELLNIARVLRPPAWSPAPGMARPSSLQRRVRAMLNAKIDRRPLTFTRRIAIAAGALLFAVVVASSGAAAQAVGAAFSGSFVDALNNAVPNVILTLKNNATGDRYTVRTDDSGRFVFDALPDGDYEGEVSAVGFASIHPFFRIKEGQSVQGNVIPLPLGTVEESITVKDDHGAGGGAGVQGLEPDRLAALRQKAQTLPLAPPFKTRDVRPLFPPSRAGKDATIFLEAVIDTNGNVRGLEVMQPADPEFGRAALDAVKEWQFGPTRLHGVPVDTSMHVTVRFVH